MKRDAAGPKRLLAAFAVLLAAVLGSCSKEAPAEAVDQAARAAIAPADSGKLVKAVRRNLQRTASISSELVPFQEIDVYAKEAGYVRELSVDYGTRVKKGQVMAVLEIPELEMRLRQDGEEISAASHRVTGLEHDLERTQAEHHTIHMQYERLRSVAETQPGLIPQQEIDEVQGKDLASEARVEAAASAVSTAKSQLAGVQAQMAQHQAVFAYTRITAPFDGVVTNRYANLGTLMQRATASSTDILPLVKLAEDDQLRLKIPVPEMYVRYVHVGEPVDIRVPSLNWSLSGKVARVASRLAEGTRTMHTEVDVPNPRGLLVAGMYVDAIVTLEEKPKVLVIPLDAVEHADSEPVVRVLNGEHKAEIRAIQLGVRTSEYVEVISGLRTGEQVFVAAADESGIPAQPTGGWGLSR